MFYKIQNARIFFRLKKKKINVIKRFFSTPVRRNEKLCEIVFVDRVDTVDVVREQCHCRSGRRRTRRTAGTGTGQAALAAKTSAVDHHGRPSGLAAGHEAHDNSVAVPSVRQVPAGRVPVEHVHQSAVHE